MLSVASVFGEEGSHISNLLIAPKMLIAQKWKPEELPVVNECPKTCQYMLMNMSSTAINDIYKNMDKIQIVGTF